jgi:hypothetical protein
MITDFTVCQKMQKMLISITLIIKYIIQGRSNLCMIGAAINILTIEITIVFQALEHATLQ